MTEIVYFIMDLVTGFFSICLMTVGVALFTYGVQLIVFRLHSTSVYGLKSREEVILAEKTLYKGAKCVGIGLEIFVLATASVLFVLFV